MRIPGNLNGVRLWNLGELSELGRHGRGRGHKKAWKEFLTPEQKAIMEQQHAVKRADRRTKRAAMTPEELQAWKSQRQARRAERKANHPKNGGSRKNRWNQMTDEEKAARASQKFDKWQARQGLSGWLGSIFGF